MLSANGWPRQAVRYKLNIPRRDFFPIFPFRSLPVHVTTVAENNEKGIYDIFHGTVRMQIFGKEIEES